MVRRSGRPSPAAAPTSGGRAIDQTTLAVDGVATAEGIRQIRHRVRDWLGRLDVSDDIADDLALAVYEALANTAEHAYGAGVSTRPARVRGRVDGAEVVVTVTDEGTWRSPAASGNRGRGLLLMDELSDDMYLTRTAEGTTVVLRVPVGADRGAEPVGR